ncbi:unnamed protein product, partial [Polarella glacialis]
DRAPPIVILAGLNILLLWSARVAVHFSPQAAGSGLPEVKCILSGIRLDKFLSRTVLVAKSIGLTLALGSSLPVGKEGPFVHIASCVSRYLLSSQFFKNVSLPREDVLLAAVAVGVGTTFGAPVGGVLFALELMMPRLYETASYAACFFASTMGTLTFMCLLVAVSVIFCIILASFCCDLRNVIGTNCKAELVFLLLCVGIGAICGTLGGLFVRWHRKAMSVMNALRGIAPLCSAASAGPSLQRDFLIFSLVGVGGAALQSSGLGPLLELNAGPLLTDLFSTNSAASLSSDQVSIGMLLGVCLAKFVYTLVALTLPVPSGVVAPSLVLGAFLGRLTSAVIPLPVKLFLAPSTDFAQYEAIFTIVGATAFCGSVCRVHSVVVTVFELIAVPRLILPLVMATITANYCGNKVGPSIFDSILLMKKIPAMPTLTASFKALQPVSHGLSKPWRSCKHTHLSLVA